jgi:glycosyltransferase involved in cell wall biosynthesis
MDLPLVSIITPSLNQAKWLEATIQSVLAQTYTNVEYIIIDGGSTDGSKEIIEKYSHQLKYWQSKPDQGQANAINIGFTHCKGALVAYLNADDLLEPNAVEGILNAYEVNQEFSIYLGKCKTIDENGILLLEGQGNQIRFHEIAKNGMLPNIFQPACFFNVAYLLREKFVDEKYKFAFDFELILHLLSTKSLLFLNRNIASYRVHNGSKSNLFKVDAFKEKLSIQEKYSKKDFFLFKWRRIKLAIAQKTGKISNG